MGEVDVKNALLAGDPTVGDETEEVKTHAGVLVVRALTRGEVLGLQDAKRKAKLTYAQFEAHMVSKGLVTPAMTVSEVEQWQSVERASGALEKVTEAITRLSGLEKGADKSRVPATGE